MQSVHRAGATTARLPPMPIYFSLASAVVEAGRASTFPLWRGLGSRGPATPPAMPRICGSIHRTKVNTDSRATRSRMSKDVRRMTAALSEAVEIQRVLSEKFPFRCETFWDPGTGMLAVKVFQDAPEIRGCSNGTGPPRAAALHQRAPSTGTRWCTFTCRTRFPPGIPVISWDLPLGMNSYALGSCWYILAGLESHRVTGKGLARTRNTTFEPNWGEY